MGWLDRALEARSYRVQTTNPQNPAYWLTSLFGMQTSSGISVNPDIALNFSAVYAACRIYANDVGTLPFPIFRRGPKGAEEARDHPAWRVFNRAFNPEMTASAGRQALQGHAVLRGNAFAEIEWDQTMRLRALWPLRPDRMTLLRNGQNAQIDGIPPNQLVYSYQLPNGQVKAFAPENIFHLKGYSPDGLWGYSMVRQAREGVALALAAQQYLGRFYDKDGHPGVMLKHPGKLSDQARKNLRESWEERHEGLSNAHRLAILEEGMDLTALPMNFDDAQFLESRKFEVTEIARWSRLPPHLLADLDRSTNNNIEWQGLEYTQFSIRPWCVGWEQEAAQKNITIDPFFGEHNMDGLMRGDAASRGAFYKTLRDSGGITPNQIASKENFPISSDPMADQILIPLNSVPASAFDENGLTYAQRVQLVIDLVGKAGYEPASALKAFGLPVIDHTGLIPRVTLPAPDIENPVPVGSGIPSGDTKS